MVKSDAFALLGNHVAAPAAPDAMDKKICPEFGVTSRPCGTTKVVAPEGKRTDPCAAVLNPRLFDIITVLGLLEKF